MRNLLSVVVLVFLFSSLSAQKYPFKSYNIKDGLAQSQVTSITQDRFGFLWLGTQSGGLSRFDGQNFKNYYKKDGLASNVVNAVHFSKREDKLWIGTSNGLMYFNGLNFIDVPFSVANEFDKEVQKVVEDHLGQIWFTTFLPGVRCYGQGKVKQYGVNQGLSAGRVSDILTLNDSRLIVSTYADGIYQLEDTSFVRLDINLNKDEKVTKISQYSEDAILIATHQIVYIYDFKTQALEVFLEITEFNTSGVWDIEKDQNGTIWFGTSKGVIAYSTQRDAVAMNSANGFSDNQVMDLFVDNQNGVWLGSDANGLSKFLGSYFTIYDETDSGNIGAIMSMLESPDGKIVVSTYESGLYLLEGNKFVGLTLPGEDPSVFAMAYQEKALWVAGRSGLLRIAGKERRKYSIEDGLPAYAVTSLKVDYQNKLWATTRKGIATFNGKSFDLFAPFDVEKYGIPRGLYRDGSKMIINTTNSIFIWDGDSLLGYHQPEIFEDTRILSVHKAQEDGKYLIGTLGEGIFQIDFKSSEIIKIDQEEGLISDVVYQIFKDKQGNYYAGTEKGISQISFTNNKDYSIRNIDSENGFLALETNQGAVLGSKDGHIWIGTISGLYKFNPSDLKPKSNTLRTNLVWVGPYYEVKKWNAEYTKQYGWFNLPEKLIVSYQQNHLTFKFAAIDLAQPNEVYYRVKLEGFDKDWSEILIYGKASYPNLPAGKYTLMIQASGHKAIWGKDFLSYDFVVKPPFWQTWWFYSFVIIGLGLALKFVQDRRIQIQVERAVLIEKVKVEEHEKIRKSVARDFHDELGNHLASIIVIVQLLRQKIADKGNEANSLVDQMEDSAKTLFNGTRDFIWSIDPENDNMDAVYCNVKDFGEELFDHTPMSFYTETIPPDIPTVRLPANWSRHITLLFKEAMTNSLKYAVGTECRLIWNYNIHGLLTITFIDNGKGFEYSPEKSRRGLANMRHRAQKLDGKLHIITSNGQGCKVKLELKIPTIG